MVWTSENGAKEVEICVNGETYTVEVENANELVEKIKEIARSNGIKKFEVVDSEGNYLTPASITENFSDIDYIEIKRKDEAGVY